MTGLRCVRTDLGEPDASGLRSPRAVPGSDFASLRSGHQGHRQETWCVFDAFGVSSERGYA